MYFSISAPQSVTLPSGEVISFRVNPADSSLVEMHIATSGETPEGTHVLTFKRNGGPNDTSFVPATNRISEQPKYKSVDDDAVRGDSWRNPAQKSAGQQDAKPIGTPKTDPVHGVINTAGADQNAGKPREARPEDASRADLAERAGVGIPPKDPELYGKADPNRGYAVDTKPAA